MQIFIPGCITAQYARSCRLVLEIYETQIIILFLSKLLWESIKSSGDTKQLSSLLLQICTIGNFEVLNEIFEASNEPEWTEHIQELLIDVIWLLGN
jgi:hypothetical protein